MGVAAGRAVATGHHAQVVDQADVMVPVSTDWAADSVDDSVLGVVCQAAVPAVLMDSVAGSVPEKVAAMVCSDFGKADRVCWAAALVRSPCRQPSSCPAETGRAFCVRCL